MSSIEKKIMKQGGPGVVEKKIAELTKMEQEMMYSPTFRAVRRSEPMII